MSKIKQFFCTHYHSYTKDNLPIYDIYPKKSVWPAGYGSIPRYAKNDVDAVTCIACGLRYFVTDGGNTVFEPESNWYIGKLII